MSEHAPRELCVKHKLEAEQVFLAPSVNNGLLSQNELKALEVPLGKKNMERIRSAGDVDKVLNKISADYKHLIPQGVGRPRREPT